MYGCRLEEKNELIIAQALQVDCITIINLTNDPIEKIALMDLERYSVNLRECVLVYGCCMREMSPQSDCYAM